MKRNYLLVILMLAISILPLSAQLKVNKSAIKAFNAPSRSEVVAKQMPSNQELVGKAYGVRVYSDDSIENHQLVSFDLSTPNEINVEKELTDLYIRAAAYADGTYYMINSVDGIVAYDLIALDMNTYEMRTVASYDLYSYGAALIFLDMAYDKTTQTMYGIAYDLTTSESTGDEEEIEVELSLVKIDLTTGEITQVGHQNFCSLVCLAANAEGYLWGLDINGELWEVSKRNGKPTDCYGYAADLPYSIQSMAFNDNDNHLYWAGFSATTDNEGNQIGNGFLSQFVFKDDVIEYNKLAGLGDNSEIVGLYIDPNPLPKTALDAPTNLVVKSGENGASTASLTWNNPTLLLNGEQAAETFQIKIYRDDVAVATLENQVAGAAASWSDTNVPTGYVRYKVVGVNASGEGKAGYSQSVYIGKDVPSVVDALEAVKTLGKDEVTVSWKKPLAGKNGGWYDEASLQYTLVRYPDNKVLLQNTTDMQYIDSTFETLKGYTYVVTASNSDGKGDSIASNRVVVGPALATPYDCDFSTDALVDTWTVIDADKDGMSWFKASYASTGQCFMKYAPETKYNPATEASDWLISPPITLSKDETYILNYDLFLFGALFPFDYSVTIGREATTDAQSTILLQDTSRIINMEFLPNSVVFSVQEDGVYYIGVEAQNAVLAQITNINIEALPDVDLAIIDTQLPILGNVNTPVAVDVVVKNCGASDVDGFSLDVKDAADNTLASVAVNGLLKSQEADTCTIQFTPTAQGAMKVYVEVTTEGDANADNNIGDELSIDILEEGSWAHLNKGTALMNYTPFVNTAVKSSVYTIYNKQDIGYSKGNIKGLKYYYQVFNNWEVADFDARIYLYNTTDTEFKDVNHINKKDMTLVYEGTISIDSYGSELYIPLTKEFAYTGQNLCVLTEYQGQGGESGLMFYGWRNAEDELNVTLSTWSEYIDTNGVTETIVGTENANVSFFMTQAANVENTMHHNDNLLRREGNLLRVMGDNTVVSFYSIAGIKVQEYVGATTIALDNIEKGIYIIKATDAHSQQTIKVIL